MKYHNGDVKLLAEGFMMPCREWINYVDPEKVTLYPLQFANCDRLQKNDVVYIFDEVGCGKTISSGIMALDYLKHNPNKKVLVITVNALVKHEKDKKHGAFLSKWYEKLPFDDYKATIGRSNSIIDANRFDITIVNNWNTSFKEGMKYGLVIIDEAHIFLNPKAARYKNLVTYVRADKVVFLTATPVKRGVDDLKIYTEIAENILNKEIEPRPDINWITSLSCTGKKSDELICSAFNLDLPVTRYFKDTIQNLTIDDYQKINRQRRIPQIWGYSGRLQGKNKALLDNINKVLKEEKESKFVVFVHKVQDEAYQLADFLGKNGFTICPKNNSLLAAKTCHEICCSTRSYAVVTGDNSYDLEKYSSEVGVPTVLILTYQIAEQGVDLPGYNYVINYHISAFPSSMEQRFGRIDRLNKVLKNEKGEDLPRADFAEITMCFLLATDGFYEYGSNNVNFSRASYGYAKDMLSSLPSRNAFLTENIMGFMSEEKNALNISGYAHKLNNIFKSTSLHELYSCLLSKSDSVTEQKLAPLIDFLEENHIEIDEDDTEKSFQAKVLEALNVELECEDAPGYKEYKFCSDKNNFYKNSDNIFYFTGRDDDGSYLLNVTSAKECSEMIQNSEDYKKYVQEFEKKVKLPLLLYKYKTELKNLNKYYEEEFGNNNFVSLFTYEGIRGVLKGFLESRRDVIDVNDSEKLLLHAEEVVFRLPIYRMFSEYGSILKEYLFTENCNIRERYNYRDNGCLEGAKIELQNRIFDIGLSESFIRSNFVDNPYWIGEKERYFRLEYDKSTGLLKASRWLKLAYWYTRRECLCLNKTREQLLSIDDNIFYKRESCLRYISNLYIQYKEKEDIHDFTETAFKNNIILSNETLSIVANRVLNCDWNNDEYVSAFKHFIFCNGVDYRTYPSLVIHIDEKNDLKIQEGDIWTAGIYYELYGKFIGECKWGDILNLPEDYKDMLYLWEEGYKSSINKNVVL